MFNDPSVVISNLLWSVLIHSWLPCLKNAEHKNPQKYIDNMTKEGKEET